jgi:hypothetical protein
MMTTDQRTTSFLWSAERTTPPSRAPGRGASAGVSAREVEPAWRPPHTCWYRSPPRDLGRAPRARSSVGERCLHTAEARGSIPLAPTHAPPMRAGPDHLGTGSVRSVSGAYPRPHVLPPRAAVAIVGARRCAARGDHRLWRGGAGDRGRGTSGGGGHRAGAAGGGAGVARHRRGRGRGGPRGGRRGRGRPRRGRRRGAARGTRAEVRRGWSGRATGRSSRRSRVSSCSTRQRWSSGSASTSPTTRARDSSRCSSTRSRR